MKKDRLLPAGFVFLKDIDASILQSPRYHSQENFLGRQVNGYQHPAIICTEAAALALKAVQQSIAEHGYQLVVYDAYRPQRAVDDFIRWSADIDDIATKAWYYPGLDKATIFSEGYVAKKSTHTRGSTVDLSLVLQGQKIQPVQKSLRRLADHTEIPFLDDNSVDMGSSFDLFHVVSHHDSALVSPQQNACREFLRTTMQRHGFADTPNEWWHYSLIAEPYPDTYFDFIIE